MPERRHTRRFSVRLDAEVVAKGDLHSAQATNASLSGCLLVTLAPLKAGEKVEVSFLEPALPKTAANVIRARKVGDFVVAAIRFQNELSAKDFPTLLEARESEAAADIGSLF